MAEVPPQFTHDDYTVAWICALPKTEFVAARAMLDDKHPMLLATDSRDTNAYRLGRIGPHNVVIACLPAENTGKVSAAIVAKDLLRSFKGVRFGLMVGVGGGAPYYNVKDNENVEDEDMQDGDSGEEQKEEEEEDDDDDDDDEDIRDIRLGDVVISLQSKSSEAVVQYDSGKSVQGKEFIRTGILNKPPKIVLSAVSMLQGEHELKGHDLSEKLAKMLSDNPRIAKKFKHPGLAKDQLFKSDSVHPEGEKQCRGCRGSLDINLVKRNTRRDTSIMLHYGTIGSADQLMRDATLRDKWSQKEKIKCFEMEAAGLMDDFPCLIIRGICDYSDSHKNNIWQPYAAAIAAIYAKDLLLEIPGQEVKNMPRMEQGPALERIADNIMKQTEKQENRYLDKRQRECLHVFKSKSYEDFKNNNQDRFPGTCKWVLNNPKYMEWFNSQKNDLLWISADPGCGKSVLSRSLVDHELCTPSRSVCHFFFKDNDDQNSVTIALCALLHQVFSAQPQLLKYATPVWEKHGESLQDEVNELWRILVNAATDPSSHDVVCVLDALDECRPRDRKWLLNTLSGFYSKHSVQSSGGNSLKFLVTSRPYDDIECGFQDIPNNLPNIRLSGEKENDTIHKEIDLVIQGRVAKLAKENKLEETPKKELETWLLKMEHRTYLWLHLAIEGIEKTYKNSPHPNRVSIKSLQLPSSIDDAYEKILSKIEDSQRHMAIKILHIIVGARRPLGIDEMAIAFGLALGSDLIPPDSPSFAEASVGKHRLKKILRLCGLFIFINHERIYLIHQTAKEFLVQKQDQANSDCWKYCLKPHDSETIMATICIDYLLLNELNSVKLQKSSDRFIKLLIVTALLEEENSSTPKVEAFLEYSAEHWPEHFRNSTSRHMLLKVSRLYRTTDNLFNLWFPLLWQSRRPYEDEPNMNSVRLAAFNGHDMILSHLLNDDSNELEYYDAKKRTALIWAAELGHEAVVKLLLDKNADVNARGGEYGNALQAASYRGHEAVVKLLLDKNADVNAQEGYYSNALYAASSGGHEAVVKLLLDKNADVNTQGGYYGNALQAASLGGHEAVVKLLLDKNADVNARGGYYSNALHAASSGGHEAVVKLLLDKNADVNAQGEYFGNALHAASSGGHEAVVKLLLDNNADVNAQEGYYSNALYAASSGGHEAVVKLLLDKNADTNARGGEYGNALQAASYRGHEAVVKLLLDKNADANAQGGIYGNALHAASLGGHEAVVKLLLDKNADVNAQGGIYGNALYAASSGGHEAAVKLLLDKNADVNAQGGRYGNALQAASYRGHEAVVKLLVDTGKVKADLKGNNSQTPLSLAAKNISRNQ